MTTPPGLLAIGYHAYSLRLGRSVRHRARTQPSWRSSRSTGCHASSGLRALTLGPTGATSDDWDADINILQFSSPAAAAAELNYSNAQNKKSATTIPLPGCPTRPLS